ncbi:MAG TPA: tetratricopeptide repeat protein [Trichormus sp.]|jgi:tetratricopeptide (TPR) repeat protein
MIHRRVNLIAAACAVIVLLSPRAGLASDAIADPHAAVKKLLTQARMYKESGHPKEAERELDAAVNMDPKDVDAWIARSFFYSEQARFDKALSSINQGLALRPHDPGMLLHRANLLFLSGDKPGCVVAYKQALDSQPSNLDFRIRYLKSKLDLFKQGDANELKKLLAKAIEDSPKNSEYPYWRADILEHQHDYRGAAIDIAKGFEANNKTIDNFAGHLETYIRNHRTDLALQTVSTEIKLHPQISGLYGIRAGANIQCQRFDDARRDIQTALKIDPKNGDVIRLRGNMKCDLLDYDGAVADYTECLTIDPNDCYARVARGGVYKEIGRPKEGLADYQYLKEHCHFGRDDVNVNLADCESALHNYAAAEQLYRESCKDDKPAIRFRALLELAKMFEQQKRYQDAIEMYMRINKLHTQTSMFERSALCYMQLKNWPKAVEDMSVAIKGEPQDGGYYSIRADAYMQLHDYQHAIADYTSAIQHGREQTSKFMRMRADAYDKNGQKELADKDRRDASNIIRDLMNYH